MDRNGCHVERVMFYGIVVVFDSVLLKNAHNLEPINFVLVIVGV